MICKSRMIAWRRSILSYAGLSRMYCFSFPLAPMTFPASRRTPIRSPHARANDTYPRHPLHSVSQCRDYSICGCRTLARPDEQPASRGFPRVSIFTTPSGADEQPDNGDVDPGRLSETLTLRLRYIRLERCSPPSQIFQHCLYIDLCMVVVFYQDRFISSARIP